MLSIAVLATCFDDRIATIDFYSDLMTTALGRIGRYISNKIMGYMDVSNQPRRPFGSAPFSSSRANIFRVVPPIIAKVPVQAFFIRNVLDRLLFTILENL